MTNEWILVKNKRLKLKLGSIDSSQQNSEFIDTEAISADLNGSSPRNNQNSPIPIRTESEPKTNFTPEAEPKINEPCWFFNTGGCKNKDGTEKSSSECKYLHIKSSTAKRPPHLTIKTPCDKYNLEGVCKWGEWCKYSHRVLDAEEWSRYYPEIPFTYKTNIQKRQVLENKITELEGRVKILEYKIKCMDEYYEVIKDKIV